MAQTLRYEEFRSDVVKKFPNLSNRLSVVAEYVLDHPEVVAMNTIIEVAARAKVQPATVMRFAQAFSFSGYSEMREIFREEVLDRLRRCELRSSGGVATLKVESKEKAILRSVAEINTQSIANVCDGISSTDLVRATKILGRAETVYIAAKCRSIPLGTYVASELNFIGRRNRLLNLWGDQQQEAQFLTKKDVLLGIWFPPQQDEILEVVEYARTRSVDVISITNSPLSPIAKHSTVCFEVQEPIVDDSRYINASLCLCQALVVALASSAPPKSKR